MSILEVTALAVIVFGGMAAFFLAKSPTGRVVAVFSGLALMFLAGLAINERLAAERLWAPALAEESPVGLSEMMERARKLCEERPDSLVCQPPDRAP